MLWTPIGGSTSVGSFQRIRTLIVVLMTYAELWDVLFKPEASLDPRLLQHHRWWVKQPLSSTVIILLAHDFVEPAYSTVEVTAGLS